MQQRKIALSLSGAGHLLPYHIGVCEVFRDALGAERLASVAGCSSGAIAATLFKFAPHKLEDFVRAFMAQRGGALALLQTTLAEDWNKETLTRDEKSEQEVDDGKSLSPPVLCIGVTRNKDGHPHQFRFSERHTRLIDCIRASCHIPYSFHPFDMLQQKYIPYPVIDGRWISGDYFCDGGISAPAPETPAEDDRIVVSPISGSSGLNEKRISPVDESFSLGEKMLRGGFSVKLSVQNLTALRMSAGAVASNELEEWYERGTQDAQLFLDRETQVP